MNRSMLTAIACAACAAIMLVAPTAEAGPDKARAEAYFKAISGGNPDTIASFYADNAEFRWVGGPLAGVYNGKSRIKAVWQEFSLAAGDVDYKVLDLDESQNGKRSTVTARVNFIGPKEVPVKFTLVYEGGKIVSQIWQVDKPADYAKGEPAPGEPVSAQLTQREEVPLPGKAKAALPEKAEGQVAAANEVADPAAPPVQANAMTAAAPDAVPPSADTPPPVKKKAADAPARKPGPATKKTAAKSSEQHHVARNDDRRNDGYYDDDDGDIDAEYGYYDRSYREDRGYEIYGGYGGYGRYRHYGRYRGDY